MSEELDLANYTSFIDRYNYESDNNDTEFLHIVQKYQDFLSGSSIDLAASINWQSYNIVLGVY